MHNKNSLKQSIGLIELNISRLHKELAKRQVQQNNQLSGEDTIENLQKEIDANKIFLGKLKSELLEGMSNIEGIMNPGNISEAQFKVIKKFAAKFIDFIIRLQNDKNFCDFIMKNEGVKRLNYESAGITIRNIVMMEIAKCFNQFSDLKNSKSKEYFALLYLQTNMIASSSNKIEFENISLLYINLEKFEAMINDIKAETEQTDIETRNFFKFSTLLKWYDPSLKTEYLSNLYQFSSIVVKADGIVTKLEEENLKRIMALNKSNDGKEMHTSIGGEKDHIIQNKQKIDEILEELNELTGLEGVKREINTLINFIKVQKARTRSGLKSSSISYHIVFTGNPGTGKTTVARIIAKIYKSLGVLSSGQLIETDRSGLIAEYVGQTAIKVNKIIDSAVNGVLFIDEAYSIAGETDNDFGKEAVATLIKRMEDNRESLIVVMAGYTKEMNKFIETNPGFKSRFNRHIEFSDYTPEELLSIYDSQCAKLEYKLTTDAQIKLISLLNKSYNERDYSFGNGRFVRNTFEKTLERQANRIAGVAVLDKEILCTIAANDIP